MKNMKEHKKMMMDAIVLAIDALRVDIRNNTDPDDNHTRAQAIKRLVEAYQMAKKA